MSERAEILNSQRVKMRFLAVFQRFWQFLVFHQKKSGRGLKRIPEKYHGPHPVT